jgi:hypothetical protein
MQHPKKVNKLLMPGFLSRLRLIEQSRHFLFPAIGRGPGGGAQKRLRATFRAEEGQTCLMWAMRSTSVDMGLGQMDFDPELRCYALKSTGGGRTSL